MSAPQSIWALGAILGEGPVWVARDAALWCVDIKAPAIHRFDPVTSEGRTWAPPAQVGWIVPGENGLFVAGLQTGIYRFDPANGSFHLIYAPEAHLPRNRLNDATVDARGRIWFGSMDDAEEEDTGRIWRFGPDGCIDTGLPPVSITNGPAISPDGQILYHHDTLRRRIWASRIEGDTLTDTHLFAEIEAGAGYPDGPVVDAENCLWVALFGGWGVRRYDPSGALMETVRFPVANITKIAFGGPGLRTAYATTARKGLSKAELAAQPLAGNLFAFDPGVAGQTSHIARM